MLLFSRRFISSPSKTSFYSLQHPEACSLKVHDEEDSCRCTFSHLWLAVLFRDSLQFISLMSVIMHIDEWSLCCADNKSLPFMAMLRNLRNMITQGISEAHHRKILSRLINEVNYLCFSYNQTRMRRVLCSLWPCASDMLAESSYSEPTVSLQIPRCLQSHHGASRFRWDTRSVRSNSSKCCHVPLI